ncbi:hypothetical protein BCR33DRAFT_721280, partial [Rhizoclosmatium globosum]
MYLKREQAFTTDSLRIDISADKIKAPGEVIENGKLIFSNAMYAKPECDLFHLIWEIKKASCKSMTQLTLYLRSVHSKIPRELLLVADSQITLTNPDYSRFLTSLASIPKADIECIVYVNINLHASTSILYRPLLYLSSLSCCNPKFLSMEKQAVISHAIDQCLESAHRIVCLYLFFLDVWKGRAKHKVPHNEYYKPRYMAVYAIFESMIVFWFVSCRMDPIW